MFPAIFSVDFQGQGQRSKVTAIGYIGHMTVSLIYGRSSM